MSSLDWNCGLEVQGVGRSEGASVQREGVSEWGEGLCGQGRRDIKEDVYRSCMYS